MVANSHWWAREYAFFVLFCSLFRAIIFFFWGGSSIDGRYRWDQEWAQTGLTYSIIVILASQLNRLASLSVGAGHLQPQFLLPTGTGWQEGMILERQHWLCLSLLGRPRNHQKLWFNVTYGVFMEAAQRHSWWLAPQCPHPKFSYNYLYSVNWRQD